MASPADLLGADETARGDAAIVLEGVSRSYGPVKAVEDVSFAVHSGEVVGLLGPNGAGKTTTLRMLATLLKPDRGRVTVAGHDVVEEPLAVRAKLGYQTGDTGLYNRLTPREFIRYFGRLQEMPPEWLEARIERLVRELEMGDFADRLCGNLSTGEKQRTSLARALLADPPVLVLDEPTAGLDIVSSEFIMRALRAAAEQGKAVLFSTHIMSEAELLCDRVVVMHEGRILACATLSELLERTGQSQLSRAFLSLIGRATGKDEAQEA